MRLDSEDYGLVWSLLYMLLTFQVLTAPDSADLKLLRTSFLRSIDI
jgi:hypothetical protein